jgi:biopolymer transport protein ExbD
MSRRKKQPRQDDVQLNLASMLDMAFQLLTFFILTFRPGPVEGRVDLRMPPPEAFGPGTPTTLPPGTNPEDKSPIRNLTTLKITAFAKPDGSLARLAVGDDILGVDQNLRALSDKLSAAFADPGNPFEQVLLQVSSDLRYDEVMRVVEVCTKQPLPKTEDLPKLSFVELPGPKDAGHGG